MCLPRACCVPVSPSDLLRACSPLGPAARDRDRAVWRGHTGYGYGLVVCCYYNYNSNNCAAMSPRSQKNTCLSIFLLLVRRAVCCWNTQASIGTTTDIDPAKWKSVFKASALQLYRAMTRDNSTLCA